MYIVQVVDKKTGAVSYLKSGKLVDNRTNAQPYPHPSSARRAVAGHEAKHPRLYEYEVLNDRKPTIISKPNGHYEIR